MARESFWGSIVTYIGVTIGFLTTFLVLIAYLTPEEVGLTRVLVELATLLSSLALLGMSTSISRYFPYFRSEDKQPEAVPHRGFFFWTMCLVGIGLPITLLLYSGLAELINPYFGSGSQLLAQYYHYILPLTVCISLWTIAELYSIQLLRLAVPRVIRELLLRILLLGCYLAYAFDLVGLEGFLLIFVGAYALCTLLAYLYLSRITQLSLRREAGFPDKPLRRGFLRYTGLAILSVVGTTLAGRMDLFVLAISPSAGLRSAAVFSIGFFMVSVVEIPTRAIIGLATARIAELMKDSDYPAVGRLLEQVSRYQLILGLIIYMCLYASIEQVLSILPNGDIYAGSAEVFLFLGLAKLVEISFTACHPIVNASHFYQYSLYYTLWCVVAAFLANYYFIPLWDAMGAAIATLLTTILGYGFLQAVVYRHLRLSPLSARMLRIVGLGIGLALLVAHLPQLANPYLSIIFRSGTTACVAIFGLWVLDVAPEATGYARSWLAKRRHTDV